MSEEQFIEIAKNPIEYLQQFICPYLVGREWGTIRKCIILMLATEKDDTARNRLHMLLEGNPGSGKSEMLLWLQENLDGVFVNAELTSKVGLVGDARGLEIKPGLLADATGQLLLVDELDKMNNKDQNGLLQSMEEGKYTITKGGMHESFNAEIRTIAAINELSKIQKPLLDRFDFVFYVGMASRQERAGNVDGLIDSFKTGGESKQSDIIKEYISWVNNQNMNVFPEDDTYIKNAIKNYILTTNTNIDLASYRSLEMSVMRIAYSMAKISLMEININHINNALLLKDSMLKYVNRRVLLR